MLAKVIALRAKYRSAIALVEYVEKPDAERVAQLSRGRDSASQSLIAYAARPGVTDGGSQNLRDAAGQPLNSRAMAAALDDIVRRVRDRGVAADAPIYHVVVAWPPGEMPTAAQARASVDHTLAAVGMRDAAALWVLHRDKEHHHTHIIACKYHPETLAYLGPPKRDFLVLDKAMREIEIAQGWTHSPGPHAVRDGCIVRLAAHERERGTGNPEASVEKAHGVPGIAAYCERSGITADLVAAKTWGELHATLAQSGLRIERKRSGMIIAGTGLHGPQAVKASEIDRALSGPALEQRLGAFVPGPNAGPAGPGGLRHWQELAAKGIEPMAQERPVASGTPLRDPDVRAAQRQARADARTALLDRYRDHCQSAPTARRAALTELKAQHARERKDLFAATRSRERKAALVSQFGQHIADLLLQGQDARALLGLKDAHAAQRASVTAQHSLNWRAFCEMRARLHGDPAAIAALRGMRYREGRSKNRDKPGLEGEDVGDTSGQRPGVGSIEGDVFSLASAQMDVSDDRTSVIYRDRSGQERLRDGGQRIELARADDEQARAAGLDLAAGRFGGEVYITGDLAFRESAARECARRGIKVANIEVAAAWHEERERTQQQQRPRERGLER